MEAHGIATSLFRAIYRRRKPRLPETKKPHLAWFPKYRIPLALPATVLNGEAPEQELERILAPLGFELDYWTRAAIHFGRGKTWGDFSIRLVRLRLTFPLPLRTDTEALLEVADVCLFDTGDLWRLSGEIRDRICPGASNESTVAEE